MSSVSGESFLSSRGNDISGSSSVFTYTTTQSTRKRHPGAAKNRLAKAKEAEKKVAHKNGWHESMAAAAAHQGCIWKAKEGWIDYSDDHVSSDHLIQNQAGDSSLPSEKMNLSPHFFSSTYKSRKHCSHIQSGSGNDSNDEETNDAALKNDRAQLIASPLHHLWSISMPSVVSAAESPRRTTRHDHKTSPKLSGAMHQCRGTNDQYVERKSQSVFRERRVQSFSPTREKSKYAAASVGPSDRKHRLSFDQQPMLPATSSPSRGWVESMRVATANLAKEGHSWDPKHGFSNLDADLTAVHSASFEPSSLREYQQQPSMHPPSQYRASPSPIATSKIIADRSKSDPPGRKTDGSARVDPEGAKRDEAMLPSMPATLQNHGKVLKEDYPAMQVRNEQEQQQHENEDLHSTLQEQIEIVMRGNKDCGISALNFEEDEDYLLHTPIVVTPNVAVAKEKVGEKDYKLFSHSKPKLVSKMSQLSSKEKDPSDLQTINSRGSRRGSGPVDVDEAGDLTSEDTESSNVWNSALETDSFLQGSLSSIIKQRQAALVGAEGKREISALKLSAKKPEKCNVTWSVHARTLTQNVKKPSREVGQPETAQSTSSSEKRFQRGTSESGDASIMQLAKEEDYNGYNAPPLKYSESRGDFHVSNQSSAKKPNQSSTKKPATITAQNGNTADDATQASSASSVAAGWKSFLSKKVQAESAAAAKVHKQGLALGQNERPIVDQTQAEENVTKIKKTVSFASDSVLSDSLLDSLFDFSTSDARSFGSPSRPPPTETRVLLQQSLKPGQPKGILHNSPTREQNYVEAERRFDTSYENLLDRSPESQSIPVSRSSYGMGDSPLRIQDRSFGTDVSPLTTPPTHLLPGIQPEYAMEDEKEEASFANDEEEPSFFKRLAECRAPVLTSPPTGQPRTISAQGMQNKDTPVAYNLYLQSKRASEKVEGMITLLRSRSAGCATGGRNGTKLDRANIISSTGRIENVGDLSGEAEMKESEAQQLARARVEAMVETLYYER